MPLGQEPDQQDTRHGAGTRGKVSGQQGLQCLTDYRHRDLGKYIYSIKLESNVDPGFQDEEGNSVPQMEVQNQVQKNNEYDCDSRSWH